MIITRTKLYATIHDMIQKILSFIYRHTFHDWKTPRGKIIYIARRNVDNVGLFSYFITFLGEIAFADRNGMLPVIDMQTWPNTYLYDNETGKVNAWEYYFEQPAGISIEEALKGDNTIIIANDTIHDWPEISAKLFRKETYKLDYWRSVCKKYIRLTQPVLEKLERMTAKYQDRKILGVLVRGTDYAALKPKGHPIPPTAEQAIAKTKEAMTEHDFDAVYLATEDKNIMLKFHEAFGEKLLLPESDYINYDYDKPKYLSQIQTSREKDKYLRGLEYLVSMLFLSRCAGFITSITSGSVGLMCFTERDFEYLYVFDLGVYL